MPEAFCGAPPIARSRSQRSRRQSSQIGCVACLNPRVGCEERRIRVAVGEPTAEDPDPGSLLGIKDPESQSVLVSVETHMMERWRKDAERKDNMQSNIQTIEHPLVEHSLTMLATTRPTASVYRHLLMSNVPAIEATQTLALRPHTPLKPHWRRSRPPSRPTNWPWFRCFTAARHVARRPRNSCPAFRVRLPRSRTRRDDEPRAREYYQKLPSMLSDHKVLVLDPMLATWRSLVRRYPRSKSQDRVPDGHRRRARRGRAASQQIMQSEWCSRSMTPPSSASSCAGLGDFEMIVGLTTQWVLLHARLPRLGMMVSDRVG